MWRVLRRVLPFSRLPALLIAICAFLLMGPPPDQAFGTVVNSIESPDTSGDVGEWTSMALDSSGYPVIAYYDRSNGDLKVMHCNDSACAGGDESIASPDTSGDVGRHVSMVLDGSGNPVVSYWDVTNLDLRVLHCGNANCTAGNSLTSPDTSGNVGSYTSLTLDGSGFPVVSYRGPGLEILHCGDANCISGNSIVTADAVSVTDTALTLDGSGFPVVSYYDDTNDDLKVVHCSDVNCAVSPNPTTVDSAGSTGLGSSIALDGSGNPVVSYQDFTDTDLKLLHCGNSDCTSGNSITTPDTSNASYTSLVLDGAGNPVVSYGRVSAGDLAILHCDDANCASGGDTIALPDDPSPNVGTYTSLQLDGDGYPVISYRDDNLDDLKLVHCGNSTCVIGSPTFMVDTTSDTVDDNIGDGVCEDASGDCSLRAAIQESNASLGKQAIDVPAGTYTLTLSGASEDASATGDLDITDDVTLSGPGGSIPTIDATGLGDRVLHIQGGAWVGISRLEFTGGVTPSGQDGGGIYIDSSQVTVQVATIDGNTATAGSAGGIGNLSGSLTLEFSAVTNNVADLDGGGVGTGGGGSTSIRTTTISNNTADVSAGGIGQEASGSSTTLNNVTVAQNVADADSNSTGFGGGLAHDSMGTITIRNSLVASNINTLVGAPDCVGSITSDGYNLIGDASLCTFSSTTGDQVGSGGSPIDPLFGGLRDNGGWNETHAISVTSPAIDTGNPAMPGSGGSSCEDQDQRLVDLPLDGNSDETARCDIGAYERSGAVEEPCTPPPGGFCDTYDFDASFDTDIDGIGVVACAAEGHLRAEREETTGAVTDVEITYLDGYVDCPGDFFLGSSIPNEGTLTEQVNNDPNVLEFPLNGEFTICVTVASLLPFGDLHTCPDSITPENKAPLEFTCKIFSLSSFDCDIDTAELYDDGDVIRAEVQPESNAVSLTRISSVGGIADVAEADAEPAAVEQEGGANVGAIAALALGAIAVAAVLAGLAIRRVRRT